MSDAGPNLEPIAQKALEWVESGQTIGLGTGRAAAQFVRALGGRVRQGLAVRGVPTSDVTEALALEMKIPLLTLAEAGRLDTTFDGADEFTPGRDLVKGWGGALVREKIVAASSGKLVILVGAEKKVERLGERGKLPVEIVPFGRVLCEHRLQEMQCAPSIRQGEIGPYLTDNGNFILDCAVAPIVDAEALEAQILAIPGVVGTGLFLGMADAVLCQDGDQVKVYS
ncbi:MAG: ribose-5-phosphate isomerase RpiA [Deltaproteobacteria bacterium]